ncbi:MAG: glycosyltransferase 87 family protein [Pseudomarimonas sp.]
MRQHPALAAVLGLLVLTLLLALSSRINAFARVEWIVPLLLLSHVAWWRATQVRWRPRAVFVVCALLCACAMLALPFAEDDHHRYLWDGYITATTGSPYGIPPAAYFGDETLPAEMHAVLDAVNHPQVATIYGPLLQWLFLSIHLLSPANSHLLRAALVAMHLLAVGLALRHLPPRHVALVAWNPLLIHAGLMNLHPDFLLGWLLLAGTLVARRGRLLSTGVLAGLALAIKVSALAVLPLLWLAAGERHACHQRHSLHRIRLALPAAVTCVAVIALIYTPFWGNASGNATDAAGLAVFATQWQFNAGVFAWLAGGLGTGVARPMVALMIAAGIGWLTLQRLEHRRSPMSIAESVVAGFGLLLILSPVINAWYLLWLLPCAALTRWLSPWVTAAALSFTFFTHGQLGLPGDRFELHWLASATQWTAIAMALGHDFGRHRHLARTFHEVA